MRLTQCIQVNGYTHTTSNNVNVLSRPKIWTNKYRITQSIFHHLNSRGETKSKHSRLKKVKINLNAQKNTKEKKKTKKGQ